MLPSSDFLELDGMKYKLSKLRKLSFSRLFLFLFFFGNGDNNVRFKIHEGKFPWQDMKLVSVGGDFEKIKNFQNQRHINFGWDRV